MEFVGIIAVLHDEVKGQNNSTGQPWCRRDLTVRIEETVKGQVVNNHLLLTTFKDDIVEELRKAQTGDKVRIDVGFGINERKWNDKTTGEPRTRAEQSIFLRGFSLIKEDDVKPFAY